jgi:hypothetical protein
MTADQFLKEKARYFDLIILANRVWGPGHYEVLKGAAREALFKHPIPYVQGVGKNFLLTMIGNLKQPLPLKSGARIYAHKGFVAYAENGEDKTEDIGTFDFSKNRIDPVVRAHQALQGPNFVRAWEKSIQLPLRDGVLAVGKVMHFFAYLFPPILLWIIFGIVGWLKVREFRAEDKILLLFFILGFITSLLSTMAMWSVIYEYRLPFDPIFILFALIPWIRIFQKSRLKSSRTGADYAS